MRNVYQHFAHGSSNRMPLVLAYTVKALYPEFQVSDILTDKALPSYQRVAQTCEGETAPEFTNELLKPGWENHQFVKEFFSRNTPGQKQAHGPLLVISGEADLAIPAKMSAKTVARISGYFKKRTWFPCLHMVVGLLQVDGEALTKVLVLASITGTRQ
jgi:hypothetical protein